MSVYGSANVGFVLIGGYDVLSSRTDITTELGAKTEEITALGDAWDRFAFTGVQTFKLTQNGFYDDAAGQVNALLVANNGVSLVGAVALQGNTVGKRAICATGLLQCTYKRLQKRLELHKANADYEIAGAVYDALILYPYGTANAASGAGTAQDNGALSSNGGTGFLQVPALVLGDRTNLVIKIQHSVDNSTWADLVTFTALTVAPGSQAVVVVPGTVNRWLKAIYTWTAGTTGQSASVMVAFYRA